MRIVLDTNLLVSGVIAAGVPRRLIEGAKDGEFELVASETLLAELLDVLSRAPPAAGQTTLPSAYQSSLLPVIAAQWG